ncbi:MAG: AMP-dependent synthetase/ligase, partial [Nannocystaceae bacterium]
LYEAEVIHEQDVVRTDDVQLLFLPMAHVFAKLLEISWFATGHILAFAENINTLKENLVEVRPTLMAAVPRVFEKFYAAVLEKGGNLPASPSPGERLKHQLFTTALDLSARNGALEEQGEALGVVEAIQFTALKRLVFSKIGAGIMASLGGRMRIMVSGGAPLSKTIAWFFRDAGITILEGYGMTETAAATTVNLPHANVIGSVGPAVPGTRIRIAEDGEILVKGPGIMREYWRNPEATQETIDPDGWLRTGDIGEIDPRTSTLRITDRKKDIIITAGGKNVAPQKIENLLKTHKLISQCVVHGDKRKFLSALLTLDEEQVYAFAEGAGISGDFSTLRDASEIRDVVAAAVNAANKELASYETIKKYEVLPTDFSIESGELTAKLSVKRKIVNSKYGHIFDSFYVEKF